MNTAVIVLTISVLLLLLLCYSLFAINPRDDDPSNFC